MINRIDLGEPCGHELSYLREPVELREKSPHLLARHIPPELTEVAHLEGHDVAVGRGGVRAEQAIYPVIALVGDRRKPSYRRCVGLEDLALVVLRVHAFLEVDQHDHRRQGEVPF